MKRRVTPILTISIALILISSLAYAAKKKNLAKPVDLTPEMMTEEEALKTELLEATEDREKKAGMDDASSKKIVAEKGGDQPAQPPRKK